MNGDLVSDDLWERTAPLTPARPPRRHRFPGRKPVDDRTALAGTMYVLHRGVSWADVPSERIDCSGVTCWRRLRDWTEAGAFAGRPQPSRQQAHVIVDRHGTPLAVSLTGGNRHDVTRLIPLLEAIPRIRGRRGRPRHRPKRPYADRGYDFHKYRRLLWARGIVPKSPDAAPRTAPAWARPVGR